jgi:hypothetical protein
MGTTVFGQFVTVLAPVVKYLLIRLFENINRIFNIVGIFVCGVEPIQIFWVSSLRLRILNSSISAACT